MKSFRLKKILFLVSTFLFLPYLTLSAQIKPEPSNINNKSIFTSSIEKSIDYLYNLDFDKAKLELNKAIEADKENPAGYFYTAMVYWERILSNPYDKEAFNLFQDWTSKSIEVAEKRIKEKGKDSESLFYLGGSYGFKARRDLIKKDWWQALWNARKGRFYLKEAFELNPQNYDTYLGLGMYDYFLDKMPKIIKFFSFFLSLSGNKTLGLEELTKCATQGKFAKTEAKYVIVSIYTYLEKDYSKALPFAIELNEKYPRNPRFYYTTAIVYSKMKIWDEALKLTDEISEKTKKGEPNFTSDWIPKVDYLKGEIYREKQNYSQALSFYNLAINSDLAKDTWVLPWSNLRIGMIFDLLGQRKMAVAKYRKVLELKDISEENTYAHEFAKKYLSSPYSKNESEVPE
ncbi:MAG: hypothetical protein A2149_01065 [Candidatus Schekmanbacteria bacterium RBG_16_38_11]|uniref:Uncharacterized protein n=1 Tax=Candidatus Schekmanbacteria bacterium RBG_16_38_11 TaxID=1817880 RepID=A0A1F7S1C1_9BACT|nr:MAG: hypothetical protein A2149_01065 [Candidatus Schekmanbacteria bacterium RBG_16_38_11]